MGSSVTASQILIIALLFGLLVVFATDRFRPETVSIAGLSLGVLLGLVPSDRVFSGLTSPAVITVIEVLLIVQALGRSHVFDRIGDWLDRRVTNPRSLILALCAAAACLSSVMNNVAAFSLMLPACFSVMARGRISARWIFLPVSYATLLGGLWTSIGTPPNLVASSFLQASHGTGFALLDFAPMGVAATIAGLLAIAAWLPSLSTVKPENPTEEGASDISRTMAELLVVSAAQLPASVGPMEEVLGGQIRNIIREGKRVFPLRPDTAVLAGDRLLVEATSHSLQKLVAAGSVVYGRERKDPARSRIKAIVMPYSLLAGSCIAAQEPFHPQGVEVLSIEGEPARFEGPFEELPFRVGSILLLSGEETAVRSFVAHYELVEVADTQSLSGPAGTMPLAVFAIGVVFAALGLLPPDIALAGVLAVLCLTGRLDINTALRNLNWPIILILVAMLPLGEAVGTTGAAGAIASAVTGYLPLANAPVAVFALLGIAMAITPFVNNTAAVTILAPIALEIAHATNLSPHMLVMAVAAGASLDFVTPFGHHNNTLAYSLGQYRFADFMKFGWPVSLATFLTAGTALLLYW